MRYRKFCFQLRFCAITKQVTNIYLPLLLFLIFALSSCTIMDRLKMGKNTDNKRFDDNVFESTESFDNNDTITDKISGNNSAITKDSTEDKESYVNDSKKEGKSNIIKNTNYTQTNNNISTELPIFGYVEYILLGPKKLIIKAKLDSGAKTSSLNALDILEFERDGKKWVKFNMIDPVSKEKLPFEKKIKRYAKVKQHNTESQKRPVIMMEARLGEVHIKREFSLTSRAQFLYQVLLGRNFLNGIAIVDPSKTYLSNIGVAEK